ncbi:MAG TPA: DNA-directed RNA polymerase subunit omega [Terriglobales bacterium]|nr:DNA-directed RNA polymerase subunit omega [Terriglobales bacterium]
MEPTNEFDSKYRYILVAARRARQLQGGASKLVETDSSKACRIAQDELDAGKVSYIVTEPEAAAVEAAPAESSEE